MGFQTGFVTIPVIIEKFLTYIRDNKAVRTESVVTRDRKERYETMWIRTYIHTQRERKKHSLAVILLLSRTTCDEHDKIDKKLVRFYDRYWLWYNQKIVIEVSRIGSQLTSLFSANYFFGLVRLDIKKTEKILSNRNVVDFKRCLVAKG